jgi:NitT/TauT family transport system permease protein
MMSMSGGWFFVVASEAITVGDTTITLPGVGSYIAKANDEGNWSAIGAAILTMAIVILLYDQLLFRPIVAWADKFKVELSAGQEVSTSWVLNLLQSTHWLRLAFQPIFATLRSISLLPIRFPRLLRQRHRAEEEHPSPIIDALWILVILAVAAWAAWLTIQYIATEVGWDEVLHVFVLTVYTLIRVTLLILLASLIWVPISVWIGLRPRWAESIQPIAQFLAAFPVNLLFGGAVSLVLAFNLNPNIWLSFLIIFGTQWYIVFNVIGGAAAYPNDLEEAAENFHIRGWRWWWQVILPGILPFYVTGAITASGGSWNASIVAELVKWKDHTVVAQGVGSYIAENTDKGDFPKIVLGVAMMSIFVTIFNRLFWRQLYAYSERRLRL